MPGVKLLIAGVDKSTYLEPQSFLRSAITGQPIDRLSISLLDHDGALGAISAAQEIIVEKSDDAIVRYFGGIISRINERIEGIRRQVRLDCQDWTILLDKAYAIPTIYLSSVYANDKAIIQNVFTKAFADAPGGVNEINTNTYVQVGRPVDRLTLNRMPLTQVLNLLATHTIYEWYVDYFKYLHYYPIDAELSSYHLSDNPDGVTTFAYYDLTRDIDAVQVANVIEVVGGWIIGGADSEIIASDGTATELKTSYIWMALAGEFLPQVWRNDGTFAVPVWTQLTVFKEGDPNYTGGANQVQWNAFQKMLVFGSAPPNLANSIRVNGRYQQRAYGKAICQESRDVLGRWFWYKIVDSNIFSQVEAQLRADREALSRRFGATSYSLKTQQDGFLVGKKVYLTSSIFGLSAAEFVIERSIMRLIGGTTAEYELTLRIPFSA